MAGFIILVWNCAYILNLMNHVGDQHHKHPVGHTHWLQEPSGIPELEGQRWSSSSPSRAQYLANPSELEKLPDCELSWSTRTPTSVEIQFQTQAGTEKWTRDKTGMNSMQFYNRQWNEECIMWTQLVTGDSTAWPWWQLEESALWMMNAWVV